MDSPSCVNFVLRKKQTEAIYESISAIVSPVSKQFCSNEKSPSVCETPVRFRRLSKIKEDEVCNATMRPTSPIFSLRDIPIHSTPPSKASQMTINNPFEGALRRRLHLPVITPTLFSRVVSPSKAEKFSWSIEDLAEIHAAEIDEFQEQNDQVHEDRSEDEVQRKIREFFESTVVPSPWESLPQTWVPLAMSREGSLSPILKPTLLEPPEPSDPSGPSEPCSSPLGEMEPLLDEGEDEEEMRMAKKDAWAQTELTFPPDVTSEVDSVIEDCSKTELREQERENKEEEGEEKEERKDSEEEAEKRLIMEAPALSSTLYHPDLLGRSEPSWGSPCQKLRVNLLSSSLHTPQSRKQILRSFGTPLGGDSMMSPIGLSPILQHMTVDQVRSDDSIEAFWASSIVRDITSVDSGISTTISQTDMTLPSVLPKRLEEVLKPFCTFLQEPPEAPDVLNSSMQLRRKLLFDEQLSMSTASIPGDVGYDST